MASEEKENPKLTRRLTVPPGAMMILPLRQTVLFPSTVMPLMVARSAGESADCRRSGAPTDPRWLCRPTRSEY